VSNSVSQITVEKPTVYAFEIAGKISTDDMESMAKIMNKAFDAHEEKIDMMLVFIDYDGSESGALFDGDVISSRFRALTNVDKYVVVGAPDSAESMLNMLGKLLPVEPHTFDLSEIDKAWQLLGANKSSRNIVENV